MCDLAATICFPACGFRLVHDMCEPGCAKEWSGGVCWERCWKLQATRNPGIQGSRNPGIQESMDVLHFLLLSHPAMTRLDFVPLSQLHILLHYGCLALGFPTVCTLCRVGALGFTLHSLPVRCLDMATGEAAPHTHRSRGAVGGGPNAQMSDCRNLWSSNQWAACLTAKLKTPGKTGESQEDPARARM